LARHVDLDRLRGATVSLLVVATDLVSGEARRFDNASVTLDALVASATVPGLFPPVTVDGAWLVDGGVVQRAPVLELAAAHPLERMLVVLGYGGAPPREPAIQPVIERAAELALAREILRDVELARLRHPAVDVRVLRPSEPLDVRPLDFEGARLTRLVDLGHADGLRCLDALEHRR
jgi:NTE family protein